MLTTKHESVKYLHFRQKSALYFFMCELYVGALLEINGILNTIIHNVTTQYWTNSINQWLLFYGNYAIALFFENRWSYWSIIEIKCYISIKYILIWQLYTFCYAHHSIPNVDLYYVYLWNCLPNYYLIF